jgi:hypothetical protein
MILIYINLILYGILIQVSRCWTLKTVTVNELMLTVKLMVYGSRQLISPSPIIHRFCRWDLKRFYRRRVGNAHPASMMLESAN